MNGLLLVGTRDGVAGVGAFNALWAAIGEWVHHVGDVFYSERQA